MKLFTDNFNLNTLKILAVAEFYGVNVEVEIAPHVEGKVSGSSKFPIFETSDKRKYFSSNATCRYLLIKSGGQIDFKTDDWLEWEASVLRPYVAKCLESSRDPNLQTELKSNLDYLNRVLADEVFLSLTENFGLSDIVVWSALYPLFEIVALVEVSSFENVEKWFIKIKQHQSIINAVLKVFKTAERSSLKKSLVYCAALPPIGSQKCFMPVIIEGFSFERLPTEVLSSPKEDEEVVKEHIFTDDEISTAYESWLKGINALPPLRINKHPKLPEMGERNILVTSALPYVNNVPHLGNIIGAVLSADVFARYCRLRNYNTLYICGTDEYGTATETKAIELGVTPKEICDKYNKLHKEIYDWFNISFDFFGRTTTAQQTTIAQDIFMKLYNNNLLLEDIVEQLYCESCKRFLADRFVEGICPLCSYEDARGDQCDKCGKLINAPELKQPQCKVCRSTPHLRTSKHLFLDLPKIEPELKIYLDKSTKNGQWSNTAKVISYSWIRDGLKPRCITRDLKWGTPVPLEGFTDKVFYVWYDAPIGYLSMTANYTDEWEKWWKQPDMVQLYQFMAKDNVPFHSIIFPACQLGTKDNYTIVNNLVATEYLNYEDVKFSKSRGIGVFGDDAKDTGIPSDIWRFYLLYLRPENQDTFFSWSDLMLKNNSELLNNLGNFINRALMFIANNFSGVIPEMHLAHEEKLLLAQVGQELRSYINCMEKTKLRDAIRPILNISRIGNQFIQSKKPWELIKGSAADKAIAGTVLGLSANISCLLCTLLEPYMPETCAALKLQLNSSPEYHVLIPEFVCLLPQGHKLGKPVPLFRKIDQDLINQLKVKYAGRQSPEKHTIPPKPDANHQKLAAGENVHANALDIVEIEKINAMVTEQGNKVRQLKTNKASKPDIEKEVAVLLELKKKLAISKGENPDLPQGKTKSKKR